MGPCGAGLPILCRMLWAGCRLGGFDGWCLDLATAGFGFRFLGFLDGALRAVFYGLVMGLWLGAALLCMVFVVLQCSVVSIDVVWCSVMFCSLVC